MAGAWRGPAPLLGACAGRVHARACGRRHTLSRDTAVLIVTHNSAGTLRSCLDALTADPELEIIVVDNASTDDSPAISASYESVTSVPAERNLGFGAGTNLAARHTERELLLFLNPDCVITPGAVGELRLRLRAQADLGFAGPQIRKPSGELDRACLRGDPDPLGALLYVTRVSALFPRSARVNRYNLTHLDYEREHELVNGTAACLMVRADAFRAVGGFDERFFMYGEDLDLCRSLRQAGYGGVYVPSARVLHVKGESSRQRSGEMLVEFHRAMWLYYLKHEAPRRPRPVNLAVAVGVTALGTLRLAANTLRREKRVSRR